MLTLLFCWNTSTARIYKYFNTRVLKNKNSQIKYRCWKRLGYCDIVYRLVSEMLCAHPVFGNIWLAIQSLISNRYCSRSSWNHIKFADPNIEVRFLPPNTTLEAFKKICIISSDLLGMYWIADNRILISRHEQL